MENARKSLLDATRDLLRNRPASLTLDEISQACGVSKSWLDYVLAGKTRDPSVNAIQRVYEYLTKQPLGY